MLDKIDEIVPPGTDLNETDVGWVPAAIADASLRRRPQGPAARTRGLFDAMRPNDREGARAVLPALPPVRADYEDGSSGATGTEMAGASVPPSISNTLPVTHELASETR